MIQRPRLLSTRDAQAEGAYTNLERLVGLHRQCTELRLGRPRQSAAQAGEWKTRSRGRGIDFEEVRLYQPGDDIRSIDWRVTARTQQTHTRVYQEERERPVILAADMRSPMFFGSRNCFKSVMCATLTASLAWGALAGRDRVGGLVYGDQQHRDIRPKRSKHTVLELIRQLHEYSHQLTSPCASVSPAKSESALSLPQSGGVKSLAGLLEKLLHICKPGTSVCLSSDFHDFDDDCRKRLYQLARHTDVTLFMINDPLELGLPQTNSSLWVTDGQRRRLLSAGSDHGARVRNRARQLQSVCGPLGIALHPLLTTDSVVTELIALFGPRRSASVRREVRHDPC